MHRWRGRCMNLYAAHTHVASLKGALIGLWVRHAQVVAQDVGEVGLLRCTASHRVARHAALVPGQAVVVGGVELIRLSVLEPQVPAPGVDTELSALVRNHERGTVGGKSPIHNGAHVVLQLAGLNRPVLGIEVRSRLRVRLLQDSALNIPEVNAPVVVRRHGQTRVCGVALQHKHRGLVIVQNVQQLPIGRIPNAKRVVFIHRNYLVVIQTPLRLVHRRRGRARPRRHTDAPCGP
mmetsp:Transcript_15054/g.28932  ORF Transcript_15054/g.28932 Transcript_15054/m.28932 type:complete len:235 (+) Transcript_15054:2339-3043(+)